MGWVDARELAVELGCGKDLFERHVARGKLLGRVSPISGALEVDRDDLERWLTERGVTPNFRPGPDHIDPVEASRLLGARSTWVVHRAVRLKQVPVFRTANGRWWLHKNDLEAWRTKRLEQGLDFSDRPGPDYLTLEEANEQLGLRSRGPVYLAIQAGELKAELLPAVPRARWWIRQADLDAWLGSPPPGFLTLNEACERLGLESLQDVRALVRSRRLKALHQKGREKWQYWFDPDHLTEFLEDHDDPAEAVRDEFPRPGPGFLNLKEAGMHAQEEVSTLQAAIDQGRLRATVWDDRTWIRRADLNRWISWRTVPGVAQSDDRPGPDYLTAREAGRLAGRDSQVVREAILLGELPAVLWCRKAGAGSSRSNPTRWLLRDDVLQWARKRGEGRRRLPPPGPDYVSAAEAARRLGTSRDVLYQAVHSGKLASVLSSGVRWIRKQDLRAWWGADRPDHPGPEYLSLQAAAERCGLSVCALRRACRKGKVASVKIENRIWVRAEDADNYLCRVDVGGGWGRKARPEPELLTMTEAARRVEQDKSVLFYAISQGHLRGKLLEGLLWIHPDDLDEWMRFRALPLRDKQRPGPEYLSLDEVAALIGAKSTQPVRLAVRKGELKILTTPGRIRDRWWVTRADAEAWKARRKHRRRR
ncbi:MAG: helix-turn-helix domain-containing protein [Candidatus Eremiobacterota bacterium]